MKSNKNTISEAELADFVRNNAVRKLRIGQTPDGAYEIFATLTWKEGDWQVVTARRKPKNWASLDRLARHIREKYDGTLLPISLELANIFNSLPNEEANETDHVA